MRLVRKTEGKAEAVELSSPVHAAAFKASGWTEEEQPKPKAKPRAKAKADE